MTSNLLPDHDDEPGAAPPNREEVEALLEEHFSPEFINRLDETMVFRSLGPAQIAQIVEVQLRAVEQRLADRKLHLELTPAARHHLATVGYSPQWGARPLKRTIQHAVLNPIARMLLQGRLKPGETLRVDAKRDKLTFEPVVTEIVEEEEPADAV